MQKPKEIGFPFIEINKSNLNSKEQSFELLSKNGPNHVLTLIVQCSILTLKNVFFRKMTSNKALTSIELKV